MFKGVTSTKVRKHVLVEGIIGLILLSIIFGAVQYQDERFEELPTHRIIEGDSKFEILQKIDAGQKITSTVTNMDDTRTIEVVLIVVELSDHTMESGQIDWSAVEEMEDVQTLQPGESTEFEVTFPKTYYYIMFHADVQTNSKDVIDVHVYNNYHTDSMASAVLLSIPSVWMTAFVVFRMYRLKQDGRSWIDSTPSHTWTSSESLGCEE